MVELLNPRPPKTLMCTVIGKVVAGINLDSKIGLFKLIQLMYLLVNFITPLATGAYIELDENGNPIKQVVFLFIKIFIQNDRSFSAQCGKI